MYKKILLAGLAVLMVACSLPVTITETPGGARDLSGFSTYSWRLPPFENPEQVSERLAQLDSSMRSAVANEMTRLGFQETSNKPDLIFDYGFDLSAEYFSDSREVTYRDYGWVWRRDDAGKVTREKNAPEVSPDARVPKAEIQLTVFDEGTTKILWQVKADKLLEKEASLEEIDKNTHKAVRAMFKKFPMGEP